MKDSVHVQSTFLLLGDHFGLISLSCIVFHIFASAPSKSRFVQIWLLPKGHYF